MTEEHLAELPSDPSDADLTAFHAENEDLFTLPETKAITYVSLTPEVMLESIEVDEDALRQLYQDRISEYVLPERRLVERLGFRDEAAAAAAKAQIDAGETDFDTLVEERGLTLADVELGAATLEDLEEAGEAVFALEGPGVTDPLPSTLGPALYRVNAVLLASEVTFEEARDDLSDDYALDRARREILGLLGEFDDLLAGGATLEELANETEMELGQIDWRQNVTDGIAAYDGFRSAAVVTTPDDFPELIELDEGGVVALRVDEVRPPTLQPLADIRDEVSAEWATAEIVSRLEAQAQEAAQAIRDGGEMAALDLPLATDREILRDAFLEGAPNGFVEGVFQMDQGDVRVFRAENGAALVRLDTISPAVQDDEDALALKAQFSAQTEQEMANDALQLFTARLQSAAEIQINQQAINALLTQFQ